VATMAIPIGSEGWIEADAMIRESKGLLPKAEKVYDISYRHEILGDAVPDKDKISSIHENHTDIIVKGSR
jgi:hypothetical protein